MSSSFDGFGSFESLGKNVQQSKSLSQKPKVNGTDDKTTLTRRDKIQATGIKRTLDTLKRESSGSGNVFRGKTVTRRANKLPETDLWSDKYTPKSQASKHSPSEI